MTDRPGWHIHVTIEEGRYRLATPHDSAILLLQPPEVSVDVRFGNEQRTVKSLADLDAVFTEAARHQTLLFLVGDSGTLVVGVGHPTHAVLLYNPKARRPPMHALGDATADSCALEPPLAFDGRGFFDRCAIPAHQARHAAQAFFASSDVLPDSVVWEPEPVGSNAG